MSTATKRRMSAAELAAISRLFGVLSQPSRLALLQALHSSPLTVSELVEVCDMKQANVSKHLGVLHDHHLVKRRRRVAAMPIASKTTIPHATRIESLSNTCRIRCLILLRQRG